MTLKSHWHSFILALCILGQLQYSSGFVHQVNKAIHRFENVKQAKTLRGGDSKALSDAIKEPPCQPTLKQLLNFALPCLGLWISGKDFFQE